MLKLRNRRAAIPNGFLYEQRETGWRNWQVAPSTMWDFNLLCQAIQQHRAANPQFKLSTALPQIEAEVESVNVARIAAMPGADSYLMEAGSAQPSFLSAPTQTLQKLAVAGANIATGKDILFDWEESGQPPVSQELADKRAAICITCPKNGTGGLSRYFTIPVASFIQARFEKLHRMKMSTASDAQLGVCDACTCPMRLKVWTPLDFILKHLQPGQRDKLDQRCWIPAEENAAKT